MDAQHKPDGLDRSHRQSGLTLIELMIAIALSLLVLAAILQLFIGTKQSYNLQEGMARMQENGRYAVDLLAQDIGMAGFPRSAGGGAFVAATTTDGTTDQITVSYQSNVDCLGAATPVATPRITLNRYQIVGDVLRCTGNGSVTPQPLVDGVENLQVLYGVDGSGDGVANQYVNATSVAAGVVAAGTPDWDRVVSVRLALLVSTGQIVSGDNDPRAYALLDAAPAAPAANPGYRRRVFTTTIPVRNQMP